MPMIRKDVQDKRRVARSRRRVSSAHRTVRFLRVLAIAALAALAQSPANAASTLSAQDRADVQKIERYLNGIRTFKARFIQVSQNGGVAEGRLYIQRPGKMRIEYKPPVPILIVSTGRFLIFYDAELDETTHLPFSSSPAAFLLRERIDIQKRVRVTGIRRKAGRIYLSVVDRKSPDRGALELMFLTKPFRLREWIVTNARRRKTKVVLIDAREGVKLKPTLFLFEKPAKRGSGFGDR